MGRDLRPIGDQHTTALRDAAAAGYRGQHMTYPQIAQAMECSISVARDRVLRHYARMAGPEAEARRRRDLAEFDDLERLADEIIESPHVVTQNGRVVTIEIDGKKIPVADHNVALEAMAMKLRIKEQRARLIGLNAPTRHRVQVIPQDAVEAAIADLKRERLIDEDEDVDIGDLL